MVPIMSLLTLKGNKGPYNLFVFTVVVNEGKQDDPTEFL